MKFANSIFEVASVEFTLRGVHMAELLLEGHPPISIESFRAYIVLGGDDLRLEIRLAVDLPSLLPSNMQLRIQSGFVASIRLDEKSPHGAFRGAGTRHFDAFPDSPEDLARFLLLLRSVAQRLPVAGQTEQAPL